MTAQSDTQPVVLGRAKDADPGPGGNGSHQLPEGADADMLLPDGSEEFLFEDTDRFYREVSDALTKGTAFRLRVPLPIRLPRLWPERLRDMLQASVGSPYEELWQQELSAVSSDPPDAPQHVQSTASGSQSGGSHMRRFKVQLDRQFRPALLYEWCDWEYVSSRGDRPGERTSGADSSGAAPLLPISPVVPGSPAFSQMMMTIGGTTYFSLRYGVAWTKVQDWKRWRWILASCVAGGGAGALAGAAVGAMVGSTAGAAAAVVSSGWRRAEVFVSTERGIVLICK